MLGLLLVLHLLLFQQVLLFLHNHLHHFLLLFLLFFHVLYYDIHILLQTCSLLFCLHIFLFQFLQQPFLLIPYDVLILPLTLLLLYYQLFLDLISYILVMLFLLFSLVHLSFAQLLLLLQGFDFPFYLLSFLRQLRSSVQELKLWLKKN